MNTALKQKIPLFFLICISAFWTFYYQSNSLLNAFGTANYEWLFLIDGLLVLPLLCFLCIKEKKQAAIKAVVMCCFAVLIGSYIIPESNKHIWSYLEAGRYVVLVLLLLFEITAIATVFLAIKAALDKGSDPDKAISQPIKRWVGEGLFAHVLMFEARIWTFALFSKKITSQKFGGNTHFSYHHKDGAMSHSLGLIVLILVELPLAHLLVHFIWSPMAANVLTLMTLFGLLFFIAEYRAMSIRPISLCQNNLIIRCGLYAQLVIPLSQISDIEINQRYIARAQHIKRYNYAGIPNVAITLVQPMGLLQKVYLGVDNPRALIDAVKDGQSLV